MSSRAGANPYMRPPTLTLGPASIVACDQKRITAAAIAATRTAAGPRLGSRKATAVALSSARLQNRYSS